MKGDDSFRSYQLVAQQGFVMLMLVHFDLYQVFNAFHFHENILYSG